MIRLSILGIGTIVMVLWCSLIIKPIFAQTPRPAPTQAQRLKALQTPQAKPDAISPNTTSERAKAAVDSIKGESREVELEAAITGEPARPLIQYTYSRPAVTFADNLKSFPQRSFYDELRQGTDMEISSPVIDILRLFPGILPGLK